MKRIDRIFNALGVPNNNNNAKGDVDIDLILPPDEQCNNIACEMVTECNVENSAVNIDITLPSDGEFNSLPYEMMSCNTKPSADSSEGVEIEFTMPSDVEFNYLPPEMITVCNTEPSAVDSQMVAAEAKALLDAEQHSDLDSPMAPLYSPLTPLVLSKKFGSNKHREFREIESRAGASQKVDIEFSLPSDVECNNLSSEIVMMPCNTKPSADSSERVDIEFTMPSDVEFNYLPPEMITVCNTEPSAVDSQMAEAKALLDAEQHGDLDSPMAPLYSPLTPLVLRKKNCSNTHREVIERKSSPLQPMSPLTFELFQTLSNDDILKNESAKRTENYDVIEIERENIDKTLQQKTYSKEQRDQANVLNNNSDSDSDFIPNTDGESSDSDIPIRSKKINVVAVVHNSKKNDIKTSGIPDIVPDTHSNEHLVASADDITNDKSSPNSDHSESFLTTNECLDLETSVGRPKKGRKRKNADYTLNQRKQRKYANSPYQGKTKYVNSMVFRDYTCLCNKKCHQLISQEKREQEFHKYVKLGSYEAQLLFIVNSVKETPKTRSYIVVNGNKTGKKKPKEFKRTYCIANNEVCRNMFVNNFQITPKKIDISLKKFRNGKCIKDQRGQSVAGWNKTREEDVNFVKNVINSLPKYESHYRREQNSGSQYLKLGMTIKKIYELYVEKFKEVYGDTKSPVSFTTLRHIFCSSFNLRCKTLKKDTCSRCDAYNNKIKNCDGQELEKFKEEREKHLKRAEDLRNNMKKDLLQAKHDETFECITFDLEKTLPLPRIPTSVVFYKRQLWLYNCGVHLGSDDSAYCYVWIEGEAGRGAQEVGSCLIQFIKNKLHPKVQHLVLWSDCCGGQNRNIKIVLMLKAILNSHQTLKTITIKYLESGHTFLPNDTDFSKIETQLKYHERIYTAEEYITVINNSKKKNPIKVQRMKKEDFLSTKKIEKNIVNRKVYVNKEKVNWLQTKEILLKKEKIYSIYMKIQNEKQYQDLNIEKKIKGKTLQILESDLSLLWPNGKEIPQAKLDDLKSLFEFIPKDCLDFYKSLRGNDSLLDDIEGFGGETDFNIESQDDEEI